MPVSKEQIEKWKKEHGAVLEVSVEDKVCYIKKPDRSAVGYAMTKAKTDPLAMAEVILTSCWLDGDEIIKTDVGYLLGVSGQIDEIIGAKTAEVKNL